MEYVFVDKNYLVPQIIKQFELNSALKLLQGSTYRRDNIYCENVYIVQFKEDVFEFIIKCIDNVFYLIDNNNNHNILGSINLIKLNNSLFLNNSNILNKENINLLNTDTMELIINNKINNNIIINKITNNQIINNEVINNEVINNEVINNEVINNEVTNSNKSKEEELIKFCEEVMDLYQKELSNIKRLENNLKSYDTKISKLEKKKKENLINNVLITQSEYQTWKKISYKIEDESDLFKDTNELELLNNTIPILFLSKYNYINKILESNDIKKMFEKINKININNLYLDLDTNKEHFLNNEIILFCEKYAKLSKDLHYTFDHEWDYLENEVNASPTNSLFQ